MRSETKSLRSLKSEGRKILVTGSDGQLGRALQKVLPKEETIFTTRENLDIADKKLAVQQIVSTCPDIVIHTAAYTDVDGCETNQALAYSVNVKGTENIASACQKISALLVYLSTDYIFDGKKQKPYQENDLPHPLSVYGKTKLAGEEKVKKLKKFLIIRTAWIFGEGKNFVDTILKLALRQAQGKPEIKVVNDQIGSPTYALDLARVIKKLIENKNLPSAEPCFFTSFKNCKLPAFVKTSAGNPSVALCEGGLKNENCFGVYHVTNSGSCSWCEFAKEIAKVKKLKVKILPIKTAEWQKIKPETAKRPGYSVLDATKLKNAGIILRPWQKALKDYLRTF